MASSCLNYLFKQNIYQLGEANTNNIKEELTIDRHRHSVVSAQADIFAKNLNKIGKILRIFDELDEIKS